MSDAAASLRAMCGPFDIILADPPWKFASNSAEKPGRNPMRHYDCMPLQAIKDLPVREIAAKECLLLMWTTAPFAQLSWDVMAAWGFKYVSQLVWVKDRPGTGFWAKNRHEIVYIAKRGQFPCRPFDAEGKMMPAPFQDSVIQGQQRQHSRKPDALHDMIERVEQWKDRTARLEMFARASRPGWTAWGDQTTKFDTPDTLICPEPSVEDLLA